MDGCLIHDGVGSGIELNNVHSGGTVPARNVIRNNVIRDFTRSATTRQTGIVMGVGDPYDNLIYNNLIYNIRGEGISSAGIYMLSGHDNEFYNNTLTGNVAHGISLNSSAGSQNRFSNNIVYNNTTNISDLSNAGVFSTNLVGINPVFVDAGSQNFRLRTTSPAVDTGATQTQVARDLAGTIRPQGDAYDIGAYESVGAASAATPTGLTLLRAPQ